MADALEETSFEDGEAVVKQVSTGQLVRQQNIRFPSCFELFIRDGELYTDI